jgi:hypothetical protein
MNVIVEHLPVLARRRGQRSDASRHSLAGLTFESLLAPGRWLRQGQADPELKKAFGFIQAELGETRRLLALPVDAGRAAIVEELESLLRVDVEGLSIDGAWELHGALKRLNLRLGDLGYLGVQLDYEKHRPEDEWHAWVHHFDRAELHKLTKKLAAATVAEADRRRAVDCLTVLYLMRAEAGRNRRAQAALKRDYLHNLAPILLLLLVGWAVTLEVAPQSGSILSDPLKAILLTVSAGALGSTLSGVFRVRDQLARLNELRSFGSCMRVQPLIGACAGLIVLLLIESKEIVFGSIDPKSPTPAALALLAFAAGFSEPFFLGMIQRVAVIPDPPASAGKTSTRAPGVRQR